MIQLSKETNKILRKDPRLLTPEQKAKALAEMQESLKALDELEARNKAANPFWYYAPVNGDIVGERRAFLKEFLKEEDIPQKLHGAIDVHLSNASIRGASGGNQSCISGDSLIYDPVLGGERRVADIHEPFFVYAWSLGKRIVARANTPFQKGVAPLYRVKFSNGKQIDCTTAHRLLTPEGWKKVHELQVGSSVVTLSPDGNESNTVSPNKGHFQDGFQGGEPRPKQSTRIFLNKSGVVPRKERVSSSLVINRPYFSPPLSFEDSLLQTIWGLDRLIHVEDDLSFSEKALGSRYGYRIYSHSCGGQLQLAGDIVQVISPLQGGAPKHKEWAFVHRDDQGCRLEHNPFLFYEYHPSIESEARLVSALISLSPPCTTIESVSFIGTNIYYDFEVPLYHNYLLGETVSHNSKTTTGCIEALIKATGSLPFVFDPTHKDYKFEYPKHRLERKGPQHVRVIGEDYQNGVLRNLIPTYRKWAPKEHLIGGSWEQSYSSGEQTLRLIDPVTKQLLGTIEFMSNKQDLGTFQGPPRHMLVFDEEPDHEVYKENLMRFTTASSLDVLFCMTPTKGLSWTYDLFTRGTDTDGNNVDWFQIASVCNPHANIKVLREILKEMESYEELKMRLLGEFVSLSGLVYGKLFQHSLHVIEPFNTECDCQAKSGRSQHIESCPYAKYMGFLGIDPHMVKDSCAVMCFTDREDNFYIDTCYKKGVTVEEMKLDLRRLTLDHRIVKAVADPSSDSSLTIHDNLNVFQMLKRGKNAVPNLTKAEKFPGSIAAGISNMKERLKIHPRTGKPRLFIFNRPENKLLIKTFKTLQRDTQLGEEKKGPKDSIAEGIHDHHACVRYILQRRFSWRPHTTATVDIGIPDAEMMLA